MEAGEQSPATNFMKKRITVSIREMLSSSDTLLKSFSNHLPDDGPDTLEMEASDVASALNEMLIERKGKTISIDDCRKARAVLVPPNRLTYAAVDGWLIDIKEVTIPILLGGCTN